MSSLRLFAAVTPPPEVADAVEEFQTSLRAAVRARRWVSREQLHVTLAFMGAVPVASRGEVVQAISSVASQGAPVELELGELGVFGRWSQPRVIWLGVADPKGDLQDLQRRMRDALVPRGWMEAVARFVPHVTLARHAEGPLDRGLLPPPPRRWTVRSVELYRSELGPAGPLYTLEHRAVMGGTHR